MKFVKLAALVLCAALVLAACSPAANTSSSQQPSSSQTGQSSSSQPVPTANQKVVYIGPMTGDFSQYGVTCTNAMQMRLDETNNAGGVNGAPVTMEIHDDKNDPKETVSITNLVIEDDELLCVFGPFASTNALAIGPTLQKAGIPFFAITSSHPDVTKIGDYVFRGPPINTIEAGQMAEFAYNDLGSRTAALLYMNTDWGVTMADGFKARFEELGGTVVYFENYVEGQTRDFSPLLSAAFAAKPDIFHPIMMYNDTGAVLNQMQGLEFAGKTLLSSPAVTDQMLEIAGASAEGAYSASYFMVDDPGEKFSKFRADYQARFGKDVDTFAFTAYDCMGIFLGALEKAGPDRAKIRDALAATTAYEGLAGTWGFNENRDPIKPIYKLVCKDGKFVIYTP